MGARRRVEIRPHDPAWPARFGAERERLLAVFESHPVEVEHVGSTAVPGLAAKPILDLMLGAPDLAAVEARIPALERLGYEYVPELERVHPERRFFALPVSKPRTHHLHAVVRGERFWRDHLRFRDRLRAEPQLARAYERLKRRLAALHGAEREAYTEGKTAFVRAALAGARPRGGEASSIRPS